MSPPSPNPLPVPAEMRRSAHRTEEAWIGSAVATIELIHQLLGVESLAQVSMLDMGCGTKLSKAFLKHDLPIGRYLGLDVHEGMVRHLQDQVTDLRFDYRHVDLHNEMYNPGGSPMSECAALPVDEEFDVIGLFSVFTHLAPHDFSEMLRLLRPHARADGRLIFSLYLNETTPGSQGLIDRWSAGLERRLREAPDDVGAAAPLVVPDFVDLQPEQPLKNAVYSREFALSLLGDSPWEVEGIHQPEWFIQHYAVCRPG